MATEDKQRIVFEQGAPLTGDSGERGNAVTPDGGVESIKPYYDGERAHQTVFRRPVENTRRRTEVLRDAMEQQRYLEDQMRWVLTPGRADGLAVAPLELMPEIVWDPVAGVFTFSGDVVLQPINTPGQDTQETVGFSFTDTVPSTANVDFSPVPGAGGKRAYNGANLIEIIWLQATAAELAGAIVPGICDVVISGDPARILTITILDSGGTQMAHVQSALSAVVVALTDMGLVSSVGGVVTTFLDYGTILNPNFVFTGNFDRELHYIPPTTWSDFFAAPHTLDDGDTLAIEWTYYVEPSPGIDGRRQRIPSNISPADPDHTTVLPSQLFITSDNSERIPLSIPVCKRVGDDLFWLDGGVSYGGSLEITYPGEHGYTVNRFQDIDGDAVSLNITSDWYTTSPPSWAATANANTAINGILDDLSRAISGGGAVEIGKAPFPDPGGLVTSWSNEALWIPSAPSEDHVGSWLDRLLMEINICCRSTLGKTEHIYATHEIRGDTVLGATQNDDVGSAGAFALQESKATMVPATHINAYVVEGNSLARITRAHTSELGDYAAGGSIGYSANRVVRGFYTDGGMDHTQGDGGQTEANILSISSGIAIIRGRQVVVPSLTISDVWNGVVGRGGMTAATKSHLGGFSFTSSCFPLYVWLRADGTYHIDIFGVDVTGSHGEHGDYFYAPSPTSGLIGGGWEDWDYTLVDVCWLVQGNAGTGNETIRLAGYIPMGGGFRVLERAQFTDDDGVSYVPNPNIFSVDTTGIDNWDYRGLRRVQLVSPETAPDYYRSPGPPMVSTLSHLSLTIGANTSAATRGSTWAALGGMQEYRTRDLQSSKTEYDPGVSGDAFGINVHILDGEPITGDYAVGSGVTSTIFAPGNRPEALVEYRQGYRTGGIDPTGLRISMRFLGFWWDKFATPELTSRVAYSS